MQIKMHRTENQRNTIVEIYTESTRILIDGGENLEGNDVISLRDAQERYKFAKVDGVFLSHYHTDYVTVVKDFLENTDFYAGALTAKMLTAAMEYKAKKAIEFKCIYKNREPITVGDIKITPILVDLEKYNAYMLMIENNGKIVLYTGDFRSNARTSFQEVLAKLPSNMDVLIYEEGTISKFDINLVTEYDIEKALTAKIKETKGPVFVMQDITDFDRAISVFKSASANKRAYLEDLYMSQIGIGAVEAMPNPINFKSVYAYIPNGYRDDHFRYKMFINQPRMTKTEIMKTDFVMNVRPSAKKYLKTLMQSFKFKEGLIINTVPHYMEREFETKEFIAFMESKGLEIVNIRTSGHAGAKALKELANTVSPRKIVPFITEDAKFLYKEYPNSTIVVDDEIWC